MLLGAEPRVQWGRPIALCVGVANRGVARQSGRGQAVIGGKALLLLVMPFPEATPSASVWGPWPHPCHACPVAFQKWAGLPHASPAPRPTHANHMCCSPLP